MKKLAVILALTLSILLLPLPARADVIDEPPGWWQQGSAPEEPEEPEAEPETEPEAEPEPDPEPGAQTEANPAGTEEPKESQSEKSSPSAVRGWVTALCAGLILIAGAVLAWLIRKRRSVGGEEAV